MFRKDDDQTVFSTESGRICPKCGKPVKNCTCRKEKHRPAGDGVVRLSVQSKGRKGKTVTLVTGLLGDDETLQKTASEMKRLCGTGGTVKDGVIEIQGDHRDSLLVYLKSKGIQAKKAGG